MAVHVTLLTPGFARQQSSDFPGIRRYSTQLAKALNRKGVAVRVITPEVPDAHREPDGVEVVSLGPLLGRLGRAANIAQTRILAFGRSFARLPGLLRDTDIVHMDIPFLRIDELRRRCPVVASAHHFERTRTASDLLTVPFGNSYGSYTYRRADLVVVPSQGSAAQLHQRFGIGAGKIRVIHHGVDTTTFFPDDSNKDTRPRGRTRTILYVGPMSRRKNIILLLRVISKLTHPHPEARLVLVGRGPLDARIDRAIRNLHLGERVVRTAHLTDAQLREVYISSDVYASPSTHEGFGLAAVEAMACRLPVVLLDTPVSREVVGKAGILLGRTSEDLWESALSDLLNDPERAESLAQRGYAHATERYSWDVAAQEYVRVYRSVLNGQLTEIEHDVPQEHRVAQ